MAPGTPPGFFDEKIRLLRRGVPRKEGRGCWVCTCSIMVVACPPLLPYGHPPPPGGEGDP